FLHSELFLETVNLATDLPRFVQEHLGINPAALCRREVHLVKESSKSRFLKLQPESYVVSLDLHAITLSLLRPRKLLSLGIYDGLGNVSAFRSALAPSTEDLHGRDRVLADARGRRTPLAQTKDGYGVLAKS